MTGKRKQPMQRKRQGWDIHMGFILHLIGMSDERIAEAMKVTEGAVQKRHQRFWARGRA